MTTLSRRISKIVRCVKEQEALQERNGHWEHQEGSHAGFIGGFNLGSENIILAVMWHVVNCVVKSEAIEKN